MASSLSKWSGDSSSNSPGPCGQKSWRAPTGKCPSSRAAGSAAYPPAAPAPPGGSPARSAGPVRCRLFVPLPNTPDQVLEALVPESRSTIYSKPLLPDRVSPCADSARPVITATASTCVGEPHSNAPSSQSTTIQTEPSQNKATAMSGRTRDRDNPAKGSNGPKTDAKVNHGSFNTDFFQGGCLMFGYAVRRKRGNRSVVRFQPRLQTLEDRVVPSTFNGTDDLDTTAVEPQQRQGLTGHISLHGRPYEAADSAGVRHINLPGDLHADPRRRRRGRQRDRRPRHHAGT